MSSAVELSERGAAALERLAGELGDAVLATHHLPGRGTWARVRTDAWHTAGEVLRHRLGFEYFDFLSVIDWLPSPYGRGEDDPTQPAPERDATIRPGYTGGETRFQVLARVGNLRTLVGLNLKVDVPDEDLVLASWVSLYAGANWHEREAWEMYGIRFAGHPDLRKLYLPAEFEGHPGRKDYPLLARLVKPWPGIVDVEPMPEGMGGEE